LYDVAVARANDTPAKLVKFVPVIVTRWPPAVEPLLLPRAATVGSAPAGVNVNRSARLRGDVPPAVCTVTSTLPAATEGETAVMVPSGLIAKDAAAAPPKNTPVAPARFRP